MAVWSEISTSDLVGAVRIDAEFWQPIYLTEEKVIRAGDHTILGELVSTFKKGVFYILAREYTQNGIPFYRSSNVGTILPKEDGLAFITERKHQEEYKTALECGDLMIVKTGKSGASVVMRDMCNVSQDVIAVKVQRRHVNPFYLAVYLNTRFGSSEMNRWFQGQVQPHLSLEDARRICVALIPDHDQQQIENVVRQASFSLEKSQELWAHAQQLLESELGLDKLKFQKPVGYTARLNEAMTGGRIDADYFRPQYGAVRALVQAYPGGHEPLLNCADSLRPNIDPPKAPRHLFNYIELSNINSSLGIVEGFLPILGANLPSRAKRQVQTGDVIASAVVGSVDKAAIITEEQDGFLASTGFFHLRPKSVSPMYLLMLVRSQCVRMQFQQQSTGGILSAVPDSRLKHVIIPKLPVDIQEEIDSLVTKSHSAKHTSDALLDQAKSRVEQLIEEAVKS